MITPRALSDRTNAKGTRKGFLMVLGQEGRGIIAKANRRPNSFTITGNTRLEEILHVIRRRGGSNPRRWPNRHNDTAASQVNNTNNIDPLLGLNVQALSQKTKKLPARGNVGFQAGHLKVVSVTMMASATF